MVIGFDRFRKAFQDFAENYIVIGGSACDWLFTSLNAQFRATKDIDRLSRSGCPPHLRG